MYVRGGEDDDDGNQSDDDVPNKTAHVLLSVKRYEDGCKMYFRMKRSVPLRKLMNAYRANYRAEALSTVFVHGGQKINAESTAQELDMEDGDVIFALRKFYCGCGCRSKAEEISP